MNSRPGSVINRLEKIEMLLLEIQKTTGERKTLELADEGLRQLRGEGIWAAQLKDT